jgi:hypothetical protein
MSKVINAEKLARGKNSLDAAVKELIAKVYKVPKCSIELSIYAYMHSTSEIEFGYYIPGYSHPVVVQDDKRRLVFIEPSEYYEYYGFLTKETEG